MPDISALHWHSPFFLLLLFPWLYCVLKGWRQRRPGFVVGSVGYAKKLKKKGTLYRLPLLLEALAGILFILALARPQEITREKPRTLSGVDIIICVDVSGSMQAVDVPGADNIDKHELLLRLNSREFPTRLEAAKNEIQSFIKRRNGDRIGLIAFSGLPLSKCPPTLDYDFLLSQVKELKTGIMDNVSTNIAAPIAAAAVRLQESTAPRRVVILLTDGEHAEDSVATPIQAAEAAAEFDITIHCISLGSPDAYIMEEGINGAKWQRITHFKPDTLREISNSTGGAFLQAQDADAMKQVLKQIDDLEATDALKIEQVNYSECFQVLVWIGIGLIVISTLLTATILLRIP